MSIDLERIGESDARPSREEGIALLDQPNLPALAGLAKRARRRMNPQPAVTYAAGLRVTWDNLRGGIDLGAQLNAFAAAGGTVVSVEGRLPADSALEEVIERVGALARAAGGADVGAVTPADAAALAVRSGAAIEDVMARLGSAGLTALAPWALDGDPAAEAGPAAAMVAARVLPGLGIVHLFVPPEDPVERRIDRLLLLRAVQDSCGSLGTVIPLNASSRDEASGSAFDYLRLVAVTRLLVTNVPHVGASLEGQGMKIAQVSLEYGADDLGTLWFDGGFAVTEWERNIRETGFAPRCRDLRYGHRPSPIPPAQPIAFE